MHSFNLGLDQNMDMIKKLIENIENRGGRMLRHMIDSTRHFHDNNMSLFHS